MKVLLVFGVLISFSLFGAKVNKSRFSINSSMSFAGYKFLAKNNPVIKLSYQNTSRARFELFKINDIKKIVSQKRYYGNYVSLNIYKDKSIKKKRIKKWTKKLKNKNEYQIDNLKLNKLKPGVYLLYAKSKENIESAAIINISDNVLIVKRVKSKILLYSSSAVTGKPIANADVYLSVNKLYNKTNEYKSSGRVGKTDENGVFTIFDEDFINNEDITLDFSITVVKDKRNAFLYSYGATGYLDYYSYNMSAIYTDKPIYTKGEKVFYKLVVRARKAGKYSIPKESFKFVIEGSKRKKIFEQDVLLNRNGTFYGYFKVTKDLPLGYYSIYIKNSEGFRLGGSYSSFRVEEFEDPKEAKKEKSKTVKKFKAKLNKNVKEGVITLDKDLYTPYEKAEISIKNIKPKTYVLATLESKDTFKYQLKQLKRSNNNFEFDLDESITPNALIKLEYLENLAFKEETKEIKISPIHKQLTIKLEKNKKIYKANENTSFKFKVTDHKGKVVKDVELSFALVDANAYKIQKDYSPDIFKYYHLRKKRLGVITTHSYFSPLFYKPYQKGSFNNTGMIGGIGSGYFPKHKKIFSKAPITVKWIPNIITDENGEAIVNMTLPKSLAKWKITVRAITKDTKIGKFETILELVE